MTPIRTGIAFSLTAGMAYAACALVFALWPAASTTFTNALFHGLDFTRLQGPKPYDFAGFAYALVGLMAWSFLFGALFGWISARLAR